MTDKRDPLFELLDKLFARDDKPGGISEAQLKKDIHAAYDPLFHEAVGRVCDGKSTYKVMCVLASILGEAIANNAGDDDTICGVSQVVADIMHNSAHYLYKFKSNRPTHEGTDTKN